MNEKNCKRKLINLKSNETTKSPAPEMQEANWQLTRVIKMATCANEQHSIEFDHIFSIYIILLHVYLNVLCLWLTLCNAVILNREWLHHIEQYRQLHVFSKLCTRSNKCSKKKGSTKALNGLNITAFTKAGNTPNVQLHKLKLMTIFHWNINQIIFSEGACTWATT